MNNKWIIGVIIVGLLIVGIVSVTFSEDKDEIETNFCDNSCTLERNCNVASCEAVSGRSCGCGR